VDAPGAVEQADAIIMTAARPTMILALIDPFWIIRTPPASIDAPMWRRRGRDRPDNRGSIIVWVGFTSCGGFAQPPAV
jgi:hypothetical protein